MSNFLIYKASAGSGKTYNIAIRYIIQLITNGSSSFKNILAVTFSNEATSEMKMRILAYLYSIANNLEQSNGLVRSIQNELPKQMITDEQTRALAKKALSEILHDYSNFHVGTIDSFFQRVLRNLARELGKGSRFNISLDQKRAVANAIKAVIVKSNQNPELVEWLTDFIEEKIESGGSWNIERELNNFGVKIFDESFQKKQYSLSQTVANNPAIFKQKIGECRRIKNRFEQTLQANAKMFFEILEKHNIQHDVFRGRSNAYVVSYFNKMRAKRSNFNFENLVNVEKTIEDSSLFFAKNDKNAEVYQHVVNQHLYPLLVETEVYRKENLKLYNSAVLYIKNIFNLGLFNYISDEIELQSKIENRFILSQTAMVLSAMIDPEHDFSFVYEKIGADIKHVMIDEFQDTSLLQWANFKALLSDITSYNRFSMIVGDVKQSIYRWRNGDWRILNNIERELPCSTQIDLDTNYRSSKNIIEFNNSIFEYLSQKLGEEFGKIADENSTNPFDKAYSDVCQKVGVNCSDNGYVSVEFVEKEDESFTNMALEKILQIFEKLALNNYPAEKIAILCRTNREIQLVSDFLKSQTEYEHLKSKNYFNIVSNDAFVLGSSSVVQLIISALRVINNPDDRISFGLLLFYYGELWQKHNINKILFDSSVDLYSFLPHNFQKENIARLKKLSIYEIVVNIIKTFDLYRIENQSGYVFGFIDHLTDYITDTTWNISDFIRHWDEELSTKTIVNGSSPRGVKISTIHKSKGLEFDTVIVPFGDMRMVETGGKTDKIVWCRAKEPPFDLPIFPVSYVKQMNNSLFLDDYINELTMTMMDSLNVVYVAFTRAKNNLFVLAPMPPENQKHSNAITLQGLLYNYLQPTNNVFEKGFLSIFKEENNNKQHDNPLEFSGFTPEKSGYFGNKQYLSNSVFLQSNPSFEYTRSEDEQANRFLVEGNVMHKLFSLIVSCEDIDFATENLVSEGIIQTQDKLQYVEKIKKALGNEMVSDWFSGRYKVINEREILSIDSEGNTLLYRPDRVMVEDNSAIVVDYKFGAAHNKHAGQVQRYSQALKQIGYEQIKGYVWYVNQNLLEQVV